MTQSGRLSPLSQSIRYCCEALLLYLFFYFFKLFPAPVASNIGGWIGRTIGPLMGASKKALKHLEIVFPDKTQAERKMIMVGMWEHLGRVFAEYPHIPTIARERVVIESAVDLDRYKNGQSGAVFAGGHFGNWEVGCAAMLLQHHMEIGSAYRAPNNPWAEKLLLKARTLNGRLDAYSKSRSGGVALMKAAKAKKNIAILHDQKYNEGLCVPFFGKDAMTNPVFVQLAQKYDLDLIPVCVVRTAPAQFTLSIRQPLTLYHINEDGTQEARPIEDIIAETNLILEEQIRAYPEQWIWLHRRWGKI